MGCPHIQASSLQAPRPDQHVYREDCTLCFDSASDPAGIDVCLQCFNGGCAGERSHGRLHAHEARHPLAVNIRRTRKRKARDDGEPPEKKLAIKAETEEDRYDFHTDVHCFECGVTGIEKQGKVAEVVDSVLRANTYARQEEVKAWEQEMIPCEHTLCLEQQQGRQIPSGDLGQCSSCDLKENLWLCLTCGTLGCGREQIGGMAGNSHAKAHGESAGHPAAVKLGSLTADGTADIYCYGCDDERTDPELVAHLANWGIDIAGRVKTEKSLVEMQLEENLRWEFSMMTGDGKEMKPLFGPGCTGLKNLGNTCYMASVLQSLFNMPEFANRYYRPDEAVPHVPNPAEDLEIQLRKLADGLLSGRYSKPDSDVYVSGEQDGQHHQQGIAPAMLKSLVGRGHPEFSTVRQQDSFELLLHLLKLIRRSQPAAKDLYSDTFDPVSAFRFVMEQRLQCLSCMKVRYRLDEMENLSIPVPIQRKSPSDTTMGNGLDAQNHADEVQFEPVTLRQCLDNFTEPEVVELDCTSCGSKGFTKQSTFKTFPTVLAINARRFEIVNWVPTKQDVPVIVGDGTFDMEEYRSKGKQDDEEELPEDQVVGGKAEVEGFVANAGSLEMLMSMGFPKIRCERALYATGNDNAEMAAAWLFEHMEDTDIDTPLDLAGSKSSGTEGAIDPEKIDNLGAMGFSAPQARQALKETGGDMERAVDWLFNHPDAAGDFGEERPQKEHAAADQEVAEDPKPAEFRLNSIVCHKGTSIHAGHYVAFVKKTLKPGGQEEWVLFNDEKVARGADAEEMKKFAYIYFFRREGSG